MSLDDYMGSSSFQPNTSFRNKKSVRNQGGPPAMMDLGMDSMQHSRRVQQLALTQGGESIEFGSHGVDKLNQTYGGADSPKYRPKNGGMAATNTKVMFSGKGGGKGQAALTNG